ncbi:MAG: SHOCT domain-containing protein [Actinomycetota bacterium]
MLDNTSVVLAAFPAVFAVAAVIIGLGIVVTIALAVRNSARVRAAGHDPLTLRTDLAVKLLDSEALSTKATVEQRLKEVDDLLARGVISESEHSSARVAILAAG